MGSCNSKTTSISNNLYNDKRSYADIVNLMLPIYYTMAPVTKADIENCITVWNMILDDTSPEYLKLKENPNFSYNSCVVFFYDTFYVRFFDINPMSRHMFKSGLKLQAKLLVNMISLCLSEIESEDPTKFTNTMTKLTERHNERGVKSIEYGIIGEALFYSLKHCLGDSIYTISVHEAWVRIFSRMLTVIVPLAVSLEIQTNGQAQKERIKAEHALQKKLIDAMAIDVPEEELRNEDHT